MSDLDTYTEALAEVANDSASAPAADDCAAFAAAELARFFADDGEN